MSPKKKTTKKATPVRRSRHSFRRRVGWRIKRLGTWFQSLKRWQQAMLVATPIVVVVLVVPLFIFLYFVITMGDMESVMNRNNTGVVLMDVKGEVFYSTGTAEHRSMVELDDIAKPVQQALIASEDKNFFEHGGISILSTIRAIYSYTFSGSGEFGGSTLTQQLAKITLLSTDRGALRQYQAFSVAVALERKYTKEEILEMYLNSAYFGENSFGIEQAAATYFGKKPADLNLAESALLIGLLPAPSYYSPISGDRAKAIERQDEVLKRMVRTGAITEEQRTEALKTELVFKKAAVMKNDAPHFSEMVMQELYKQYGEETVERSGFQVTTTLDLGLQRQAVKSVKEQRSYIKSMGGSNAGLIAVDPRTGEIRALIGSVDYNDENWGKVNMATTARQPASTFKPIYYSAALADGKINPATIIVDEPINIGGYQPQNATRQFYGNVTVRQALARSLNIPSVKIMQRYGISRSLDAAANLGITTLNKGADTYGLSLAIGTGEVPLSEMTSAYAAFADEGKLRPRTTIHAVKDKFNHVIFEHVVTSKRAISPQGAYLISDILADQNARAFMFGNALNVSDKSVAVKTGTTDDNRDAWTIGYTPEIAIGVWVGNNNNDKMLSGGSDMAGPIWRSVMQSAIGNRQPKFVRPSGIVLRNVCYGSGGLASGFGDNTYREVFIVSSLPTNFCQATIKPPEKPKVEKPKKPVDQPDSDNVPADDIPADDEDDDGDSGDNDVPSQPDALPRH